jgi:NAD(P)H-dependent FMN reductase
MPATPHLLTIIASTRSHRRGEPIARWLAELASARGDMTHELVDLASFDLPLLTAATPPMSPSAREDVARGWARTIAGADGYMVVVPEYNHAYPAALKNALDHLFHEWWHKPIGFVSYGGLSGGVRAVEQLRQVAVELAMVPVRSQVAIPRIWSALDDDGELREPPLQAAHALLDEMVWWAAGLHALRAQDDAAAAAAPDSVPNSAADALGRSAATAPAGAVAGERDA